MGKNLIWPLDNLKNYSFIRTFKAKNYAIKAAWQVIDLVSNLLYDNIKQRNISPEVEISPTAIIKGNVIIEPGVRIMGYTKIIGPSFIGKDVIIGDNTLVRASYISDNCVIGYLVDVARGYIGNSCWLARVHFADSFLDDEVNIGGGTVLASLRLDNKYVPSQIGKRKVLINRIKLGAIIGKKTQIGANVTVLPGVKIGRNCIIGAGVVVSEDIEDNIYCKVKQELVFRKNTVVYRGDTRDNLRKKLIQESKTKT